MDTTEKLLKRLSKKYHNRVDKLELEIGLIDNCKYMLYLKDGWKCYDGFPTVACRSITDAINFIKDSWR